MMPWSRRTHVPLRQSLNNMRRWRAAVGLMRGVGAPAGLLTQAFTLVLLSLGAAAAETTSGIAVGIQGREFRLLSPDDRLVRWRCDERARDPRAAAECPAAASLERGRDNLIAETAADTPVTDASERRPQLLLTSLLSAGVVLGSAANSFLDGAHQSYHFADEGFFGRGTRNGGADKAAHFVDYYIVSKELANLYVALGHTAQHARWLGFGVSTLAGLVTEIGDGTTRYGFSYEDFLMDGLGAASAAVVSAFDADDLIGFHHGFVKTCCAFSSFSNNYDNEIFTADLAIVGVARRLGLNVGPLRYLLLSVTYASRGYPNQPDAVRQRQVGLEVGLNFKQILDDLEVRRDKWWGYVLHTVFDNVRFPYTAVGFQYDLNHGRWHGPGAGNGGYSKP